jgi:hypothetical protein
VDFDNGNDITGDGSQSSPWLNIPGTRTTNDGAFLSNNWASINASDTIKIRSGTTHSSGDGGRISITSTHYQNGTSGSKIRIERDTTWGSGQIDINGSGITVPTWFGLVDIRRDYIVFDGKVDEGILVRNSADRSINIYDVGVNGTEIRSIEVTGGSSAGVIAACNSCSGSLTNYISGIIFDNLTVHDMNGGGDPAANIYLSKTDGAIVSNCTSYNSGPDTDGIHLGSSKNSWIINNIVYNNAEQGIDISKNGSYKTIDTSYNNTIRDNISYDNYKMNFDTNSGSRNDYFINNIGWKTNIRQGGDANFMVYSGGSGHFFINNTSAGGDDHGYGFVWWGDYSNLSAGAHDHYIINSISATDADTSIFVAADQNGRSYRVNTFNSNLYSADNSGNAVVYPPESSSYTRANINAGAFAVNSMSQDPLFVDGSGASWGEVDLRLQAGSPSRDTGVFPFTTSGANSGTIVNLTKLVADLDVRRVFRPGDIISIEDAGEVTVSSVIDSDTIQLAAPISWSAGKGVWFPWSGSRVDMGARGAQ